MFAADNVHGQALYYYKSLKTAALQLCFTADAVHGQMPYQYNFCCNQFS
jgi:hypothetical protein